MATTQSALRRTLEPPSARSLWPACPSRRVTLLGGRDVRPAFTSSLILGNGYFGDRGRFDAGSFGGVMQANARLESRKRRRSGSWLSVGFGRRVLVGLERRS